MSCLYSGFLYSLEYDWYFLKVEQLLRNTSITFISNEDNLVNFDKTSVFEYQQCHFLLPHWQTDKVPMCILTPLSVPSSCLCRWPVLRQSCLPNADYYSCFYSPGSTRFLPGFLCLTNKRIILECWGNSLLTLVSLPSIDFECTGTNKGRRTCIIFAKWCSFHSRCPMSNILSGQLLAIMGYTHCW